MELQISPIWFDDDTMMKIRVEFVGNGRQSWYEGYAYPEEFAVFGQALVDFPNHVSDEVRLELGSSDPAFSSGLLVRAFVHDGAGHCAMEFKAETRGDALEASLVRFAVPTEAASLNELGRSLMAWSANPTEAFRFEGAGA